MPYLHWETDRKHRQMAAMTKQITQEYRMPDQGSSDKLSQAWTHVSNEIPTQPFRTSLGRYLYHAADVYSRMDVHHDRALLESYLGRKRSPLHGRRTLDQSYYWKLDDTGPRDQDQVIYRGTQGKDPKRTTRIIMVE